MCRTVFYQLPSILNMMKSGNFLFIVTGTGLRMKDKWNHILIEITCKACGEKAWVRKGSQCCSLKCNGVLGSKSSLESRREILRSDEYKHAQSERLKKYYRLHPEGVTTLKGTENPAWKHGETARGYSKFSEARKKLIRERDQHRCRLCSSKGMFGIRLDVHHIDYNKDNYGLENLITLCKKCHSRTNFNREYWIKVFGQGGESR